MAEHDFFLWVLGIVNVAGMGVVAWIIRTVLQHTVDITEMRTLIKMFSVKAAKILHSPHTPEFDALLEGYVRVYEENNYDMTPEQWTKLKEICMATENDKDLPKSERFFAGIVRLLSEHKLMRRDLNPKLVKDKDKEI